MMNVVVILALAIGQPPPVPRQPQAPPIVKEAEPAPTVDPFVAALESATSAKKPLVVLVRTPKRTIRDYRTVAVDSLDGDTTPAILFAVPSATGPKFYRLPADSTASEIAAEIRLRESEVSRAAIPFGPFSSKGKIASREARVDASGRWHDDETQRQLIRLWPRSVDSTGFKFYRPTQYAQRIAVTGDRPTNQWYHVTRDDVWANAPTSFNPNRLDERWRAPGGLANIGDWESFTAAYLPDEPATWVQPLPIANGGIIPGGKRWGYADGTMFADLLTCNGEAFELRIREKSGGKWDSYVAYRDMSKSPSGYHGAGRKCAECHDKAGDSEQYGILVRGADTVFSYNPFDN